MVYVAQLVERQIVSLESAGSRPVVHPSYWRGVRMVRAPTVYGVVEGSIPFHVAMGS